MRQDCCSGRGRKAITKESIRGREKNVESEMKIFSRLG